MMWLIWILLIVLVSLLLYRLYQNDNPAAPEKDSALEILRKRYARGEISKEEYEQGKQDLQNR